MTPKTKEQLFKKYQVNNSHNKWDNSIDNWNSVEIYRLVHNGELQSPSDFSAKYVCDYLDGIQKGLYRGEEPFNLRQKLSLIETAKRMIYHHYEQILQELNP